MSVERFVYKYNAIAPIYDIRYPEPKCPLQNFSDNWRERFFKGKWLSSSSICEFDPKLVILSFLENYKSTKETIQIQLSINFIS